MNAVILHLLIEAKSVTGVKMYLSGHSVQEKVSLLCAVSVSSVVECQ